MPERTTTTTTTEDGFTLIELMVVLLVVSIIIAIAIPTFLGGRAAAEDRSAQSNLRHALTVAKVHYTDAGRWLDAADTALDTSAEVRAVIDASEPSLALQDALTTENDASNAVTAVFDEQEATFAAFSGAGTCFYIHEVTLGATAGTYFAEVAAVGAPASCPAAPAAPTPGDLGDWSLSTW